MSMNDSVNIVNETCYVNKSYDEWSNLIDLIDIASDELEKDGHKVLSKKLSIVSTLLSRDTGLGE